MEEKYKNHIQYLETVLEKVFVHCDHLLISSGELSHYLFDDQSVPFKNNPYFSYFVPFIQGPDHFLLFSKGKKSLYFHQPTDFWHKVEVAHSEFWDVYWDRDIYKDKDKLIAFLIGPLKGKIAFVGNQPIEGTEFNPIEVLNELDRGRLKKTEFEIECLYKANQLAVKGHKSAKKAFFDGVCEFEIHQRYCQAINCSENELPYQNIIALNENSAFLHYGQKNKSKPDTYLSFLIDAGATYLGYHADITRTHVKEGIEFKNLLLRLEKMQKKIVSMVRPGLSFPELHDQTHRLICKILNETNIVYLDPEEIYEKRISDVFFPHGLGHSLGLQVHDVGAKLDGETQPERYPHLRMIRTLEKDNVITIEPGLYFIKVLLDELKKSDHRSFINWDLIEKLKPFGGIRIEDDVLVTADGFRNLTQEAFDSYEDKP